MHLTSPEQCLRMTSPISPFRWDISKRNQLGTLVVGLELDPRAWVEHQLGHLDRELRETLPSDRYGWFTQELLRCSARIVALCSNADLCFVGRSPESTFDYLSGLLFETSWAERLSLLHFSMRRIDQQEVVTQYPGAIQELRHYLTSLGLDPTYLAHRPRPVTFVDIVVTGATMGNLVGLIHSWCREVGGDWGAVRRKIRIIGLTSQEQTSPKTWRWQQHAPWVSLLQPGTIKNISIPLALVQYFAGVQSKLSISYPPARWGSPDVTVPRYDRETLLALQLAVALFDLGRQKSTRRQFARALSAQPAMQHVWFRALVAELKH